MLMLVINMGWDRRSLQSEPFLGIVLSRSSFGFLRLCRMRFAPCIYYSVPQLLPYTLFGAVQENTTVFFGLSDLLNFQWVVCTVAESSIHMAALLYPVTYSGTRKYEFCVPGIIYTKVLYLVPVNEFLSALLNFVVQWQHSFIRTYSFAFSCTVIYLKQQWIICCFDLVNLSS